MSGNLGAFDLVAARPWAIQREWLRAIGLIAQRAPRENVAQSLGMTPEALNARLDPALANTRTATMRGLWR